jgi:carboxyl-terminal processing protease
MEKFFTRLITLGCLSLSACVLTNSSQLKENYTEKKQDQQQVVLQVSEKILPSKFSFESLKIKPLELTATTMTETLFMVKCLEEIHYLKKKLTNVDQGEVIKNFLSSLDPFKMYMLQHEVDAYVNRFSQTLDIFLRAGSLSPASIMFENFRDKLVDRTKSILDQLESKEFSLTGNDTFTLDREKEPWPKDQTEADLLWDKRIRFELVTEILSQESKTKKKDETSDSEKDTNKKKNKTKQPKTLEQKVAKAKKNMKQRYENILKMFSDVESWIIQEYFLNSLAKMYDPHSSFLSSDTLEDMNTSLHNSFIGIGAYLIDDNGYCTVRELIPGSPAAKSGYIHPGDKIVAIAQGDEKPVNIIGMMLHKVVKLLKGKKNTVVKVTIQPKESDLDDQNVVTLVRDEVELTTNRASARLYATDNPKVKIGYIKLPAFYGHNDKEPKTSDSTHDVLELLKKLKSNVISGLILDLRDNGGGLLEESVSLAGLFIDKGPVVQINGQLGNIECLWSSKNTIEWSGPMIVLVSKFSASAAEILPGALKDHHRAIIIGDEATHGKGSVQALIPINNLTKFTKDQKLGAARITIQKWYLPSGNSTQIKGVTAHIPLSSFDSLIPLDEASLPNALPWNSITPVKYDYEANARKFGFFIDEKTIDTLGTKSKARQNSLPEFKLLTERIVHAKEKLDNKQMSLNLANRRQEKEIEENFKANIEKEFEILEASDCKYTEIVLDAIEKQNKENEKMDKADKKPKKFRPDTHLREAIRVMIDWFNLSESPKSAQPLNYQACLIYRYLPQKSPSIFLKNHRFFG